jgi:hypothetical protein
MEVTYRVPPTALASSIILYVGRGEVTDSPPRKEGYEDQGRNR